MTIMRFSLGSDDVQLFSLPFFLVGLSIGDRAWAGRTTNVKRPPESLCKFTLVKLAVRSYLRQNYLQNWKHIVSSLCALIID